MLAKTIIECDAFSNMPVEAQMLYVRLNMAADDDGFVKNPRMIMRMCGASDDSMKLLITKKFVLSFEYGDDFVFLIKHWKIHNYIQSDRYKASTFKSLLREVYLDENKAYSLTPGPGKKPCFLPMDTECIQDVSKTDTQVRLGKERDSVGEESLEVDKDKNNNTSFYLSGTDEKISEIMSFFLDNIEPQPSAGHIDFVKASIETKGPERVLDALKKCVEDGKTSFPRIVKAVNEA